MRRGRVLQTLQKFLKVQTYKNFLLKTKPVRLPQLLYTKLQDPLGEEKPEVRWPEAERRSPQLKGMRRRGKVRKPPSRVERPGEQRHPRPKSRGRRGGKHRLLGPHLHLGRRRPPLTAANRASWPASRSLPAAPPDSWVP